ncbi:hypothetical protein DFH07DRAFT_952175 [Mycena maculata]|uniref:DNA-directed RNA polymerase RBP11-like dimerisation domain-containing protein n=1 Tax=Mycena maculata TaxID=230809 RepID=A0AAD7NTC0_9AGAR|nr:hypothetical protein DFH07DRAFT_952175 [Mycena maculata]
MAELPPKVTIMKGAAPDLSAATYQIHDESHTIGNALRWMIMKKCGILRLQASFVRNFACIWSSFVVTPIYLQATFSPLECLYGVPLFCFVVTPMALPSQLTVPLSRQTSDSYSSAPHPSENVIQVRIQMYDNLSSLSALITALADLDALCVTIEDAYVNSLKEDVYERWDERS